MATLISHGADVNARDVNERTPLMHASQQGNAKIVEALLDAGANKTLKDINGSTAHEIARAFKKDDIVALLERS